MFISFFSNPLSSIIFIFLLLICIAIHEFSHAKTADYLGDPTPRLEGRLTLNPFVHLDFFGLLFLFFFGFGWGKPVPIDPFNLKNPRRDAGLISLSGPLSNFLLALLSSLLLKLFNLFNLELISTIGWLILPSFIFINLILGIFNLLPFAPLDGFKIVSGFIPDQQAKEWLKLEKYGFLFLIMFIFPLGQKSMLDLSLKPLVNLLFQLLT